MKLGSMRRVRKSRFLLLDVEMNLFDDILVPPTTTYDQNITLIGDLHLEILFH